jgi:energy-coupling factor transport system permease protein
MAFASVLIAKNVGTLLVESALLLLALYFMGIGRPWLRSLRLMGPMVGMVFVIALISFDLQSALLLSVRLINLLTVSFVFFHAITPEEMGGSLRKMGVPFEFGFILTTSMRYVPLIGKKIRHIFDAQRSRGIDLRPRIKNIGNFTALLMPLLIQSFVLSEELALAMESRGFGRKGRSSRTSYRLATWEYGLMIVSLAFLIGFAWWERG